MDRVRDRRIRPAIRRHERPLFNWRGRRETASGPVVAPVAPPPPEPVHSRAGGGLPSDAEIDAIPVARSGEYELNEREVMKLRRALYRRNRENRGVFRTARAGTLLMVWRIQ